MPREDNTIDNKTERLPASAQSSDEYFDRTVEQSVITAVLRAGNRHGDNFWPASARRR